MKSVSVPWGAWYQERQLELRFPETCRVDVLNPRGGRSLRADEIRDALNAPIEGPSLGELAAAGNSACLVVDDLARPTRAAEILPEVTEQLRRGGIGDTQIGIVVATGSHAALSDEEIALKLGPEIAGRHRVQSHDCRSNLAATGVRYGDHELQLNRTFLDADVKIVVGSVLPHTFAGFSGGAKLVLPGLADLASIARSHKFVQLGLRGGGDPNANRFRTEAEQIAEQLGLAFVVCAVTNPARETIGLFAGHVVAAHRAACEQARTAFATPVGDSYDCVILNAYPKDCDLIQAVNAFVAWKTATRPVVRDDGLVVLMTACSQGLGRHGLFDPQGVSHHEPRPLRVLGGRDLWLLAPGVSEQAVHEMFWEGYRVFSDRDELLTALSHRFPERASIAVFPCAPMQQVDDVR